MEISNLLHYEREKSKFNFYKTVLNFKLLRQREIQFAPNEG